MLWNVSNHNRFALNCTISFQLTIRTIFVGTKQSFLHFLRKWFAKKRRELVESHWLTGFQNPSFEILQDFFFRWIHFDRFHLLNRVAQSIYTFRRTTSEWFTLTKYFTTRIVVISSFVWIRERELSNIVQVCVCTSNTATIRRTQIQLSSVVVT